MEALENQLKEARNMAEEADRKYDEASGFLELTYLYNSINVFRLPGNLPLLSPILSVLKNVLKQENPKLSSLKKS